MNNTNKVEAVAATAASAAASLAAFMSSVEPVLHFLLTLLSVAWWIRLWIKDPKLPPPGHGGKSAGLLLCLGLFLSAGCASMKISILESADGTKQTTVRGYTLFDAKSELAKLRTSATDKTQSVNLSGLAQESSGTNAVLLVESITRAAVEAAIKSAKPIP